MSKTTLEALKLVEVVANRAIATLEYLKSIGVHSDSIDPTIRAEKKALAAIREALADHSGDANEMVAYDPVTDEENKAVRCFLMQYGAPNLTIGAMRNHMERCGYPEWPALIGEELEQQHLTKAEAQFWLRHLFRVYDKQAEPVKQELNWGANKFMPHEQPVQEPVCDHKFVIDQRSSISICNRCGAVETNRLKENDKWTPYLKDGETPFERFARERKDTAALLSLYYQVVSENEKLKAQKQEPVARYAHIKCDVCGLKNPGIHDCIAPVDAKAIREALADHSGDANEMVAEPVKHEPVAIADGTFNHNCPIGAPLYAAPVDAKAIRAEALEEAAKMCEVKVKRPADYGGRFGGYGDFYGEKTGSECAAAIRGLR